MSNQIIDKKIIRNTWLKLKNSLTLKNFTIVSLALIILSFLPSYYPLENFREIFHLMFFVGVWCFLLAYLLYASKCWGSGNQLWAVLMISLPAFAYSFSTVKIPDSVTNIWFYTAVQFCLYAILSVIVLYVIEKVISGIEEFLFRRGRYSFRFFQPRIFYIVFGILLVSLIVANSGSSTMLLFNSNSYSKSIQDIPSQINSNNKITSQSISDQSSQILPTIAPEIVNSIGNSIANPPPEIDIPSLERRVHELINQQRTSHGLTLLNFDSSLASVARKHSSDMARNSFFSHNNLQGQDPTARGNQAGYSCYKNYGSYYTTGIAENIQQNNRYTSVTYYNGIPRYDWNTQEDLAQSIVTGWMNSPGHRQNILTTTYDREGIGIAIASDDKVYVTEDFC